MDFIIDRVGDFGFQLRRENNNINYYTDDRIQALVTLLDEKKKELDAKNNAEQEAQKKLKTLKVDNIFDDFFDEMGWADGSSKEKRKTPLFHFNQLDIETGKLKSNLGSVDVEKEMKSSVLQPGLEKEHSLPAYHVNQKKLKALRKKEREKTKGEKWFNLPAPEITEEVKNDLQILKMRSALDPKHFYKKNDMEVLPKYFQIGSVMDSPLDHVNERLTKKQRKRTMVDELLADAEFNKYNKKKYKEIIDNKRRTEYKTFMKDKRLKNKAVLKKNKEKIKKSKA